jgi:hypothetical protein
MEITGVSLSPAHITLSELRVKLFIGCHISGVLPLEDKAAAKLIPLGQCIAAQDRNAHA